MVLALKQYRTQYQVIVLIAKDNSTVEASSSLHKETWRNFVSRVQLSPMEDHELVISKQNLVTCQGHPRLSKRDSQLTVQDDAGAINRVVTAPSSVQTDVSKVVHLSQRPI